MGHDLLELGAPWFLHGEDGGLLPLNSHTNAYAGSRIIKTGPGKLYGFTIYNITAQFIQVHDCPTVPASGAVPAIVLAVGATSNLVVTFGPTGRTFNAGCVIVTSSTGPTFTQGALDAFIDAQYV